MRSSRSVRRYRYERRGKPMHPYLTEVLSLEHRRELLRVAADRRPAPRRRRPTDDTVVASRRPAVRRPWVRGQRSIAATTAAR